MAKGRIYLPGTIRLARGPLEKKLTALIGSAIAH
jgi:hypothetical protein